MACFTAPLAEAVIVKAVEKHVEKKEKDTSSSKIPLSRKIHWLSNLDTAEMLHEIATVGVGMAVLITVVWIGMCKVADVIVSRKPAVAEESAK